MLRLLIQPATNPTHNKHKTKIANHKFFIQKNNYKPKSEHLSLKCRILVAQHKKTAPKPMLPYSSNFASA
jgi:hypothetical protein